LSYFDEGITQQVTYYLRLSRVIVISAFNRSFNMDMQIPWPDILFYSFLLITIIQLFFYLFFFQRLAFYHPHGSVPLQQQAVSMIICAKNEAAKLEVNLPKILQQNFSGTYEVVIVNHNSSDHTRQVLEEFGQRFKHLHVLHITGESETMPGKKFPLSAGITAAKYNLLLLTDADCAPASPSWLKKMQDGYRNGTEVVLGYGAYQKKKGIVNKLIRFDTFHTALQYLSYALAGNPYMGVGRNLSYTKRIYDEVNGFSSINHTASGDDDLFISLAANGNNTRIAIDKEAITLSQPEETFATWARQKTRHYSTGKHYKRLHKFLLGLYSMSHFLFLPLFVSGLIFYNWKLSLGLYLTRLIIQAIVFYRSMKKLDESDLFQWWWLFDLWMFFYYIIFANTLWKKPRKSWK